MRLSMLRLDPPTLTRKTMDGVKSVLGMLERECLDPAADEQLRNTAVNDPILPTSATAEAAAASALQTQKRCWRYGAAEGCRRGSSCAFAHVDATGRDGNGKGNKGKDGKGKAKGKESTGTTVVQTATQTPTPKPKP